MQNKTGVRKPRILVNKRKHVPNPRGRDWDSHQANQQSLFELGLIPLERKPGALRPLTINHRLLAERQLKLLEAKIKGVLRIRAEDQVSFEWNKKGYYVKARSNETIKGPKFFRVTNPAVLEALLYLNRK